MKPTNIRGICIDITPEQAEVLTWLSSKANVGITDLLKGFVADLTCSTGNGGSDEREEAFNWHKRRGYEDTSCLYYTNAENWKRSEAWKEYDDVLDVV